MTKSQCQVINGLYHLSIKSQPRELKSEITDSRHFVVYRDYVSSIIFNTTNRKNLSKVLTGKSLQVFNELKQIWFRKKHIKYGFNLVKNSKSNKAPSIENSWCLYIEDPIHKKQITFMYVEDRLYSDLQILDVDKN